jgi:ATP-dependent Clp protease ATP-binding subunit ClpC
VKNCIGAAILTNLGAEADKCFGLYNKLCKPSGNKGTGKAELSNDIHSVVKCACKQATEWGHEYIGAEHLLIAILLVGEGSGFQMMTNLGITLDKVREETQRLIVCRNVKNERKEK